MNHKPAQAKASDQRGDRMRRAIRPQGNTRADTASSRPTASVAQGGPGKAGRRRQAT